MNKKSGILMHITSLDSDYGIGTMGEKARKFVDFLEKSGQSYWQILPVCPTGYGDSPYQSFSTFAGNPYLIDLDELCDKGYLKKEEYTHLNYNINNEEVDFGRIYSERFDILKIAFSRCIIDDSIIDFYDENKFWLDEYALFMAIKENYGGKSWYEWEEKLRFRDRASLSDITPKLKEIVEFYKFTQFLFFDQWKNLKNYANKKGIKIIGDLPIYVASDSVDVWSNAEIFELSENLDPINVAGCPPDAFSADGQLWGNPLFRWEKMRETGYEWWIKRIEFQCEIYDVLRIDHFRGFDSYYSIPFGAKNAKDGIWKTGPGIDFFIKVEEKIGKKNIIAEDLGYLTEPVHKLLKETKFPGMKVLLFAFDSDDGGGYLPDNYPHNSIAYIGTHDNDTFMGWIENASEQKINRAAKFLNLKKDEEYHLTAMKKLWASNSMITIIQMQDILGLDNSARMNIPSTLGCNWKWRIKPNMLTDELAENLNKHMKFFNRLL